MGLQYTMAWYFKFPIKLFRPAPFNPYKYASDIKKMNRSWLRFGLDEYKSIINRTVPLLLLNGSIGIMLFTIYTNSLALFRRFDIDSDSVSLKFWPWFIAGSIAGLAQPVIATPFKDIESRLQDPNFNVSNRNDLFKLNTSYRGLTLNMVRDSLGFSMFFGLFESLQYIGKRFNDKFVESQKTKMTVEISVLVASGAMGGACFQMINYPVTRLQNLVKDPTIREFVTIWKQKGYSYFYKGIGGQMFRVVPVSALALCMYKLV
jgi:hypothetical protein